MVIFGAGASYDSSATYTMGMAPPDAGDAARANNFYRPPLAKELFANRLLFVEALEMFPQCKTIVYRLRDPAVLSGDKSIEALLQEIEEEARTYNRGRQELAAVRCYLQRAITVCQHHWQHTTKGVTNYLSLLREIERTHKGDDPVYLVTFNYDTLLEEALTHFGLPFRGMEDYARSALFRILKLHGSINWAREVDVAIPRTASPLPFLIELAGRFEPSDKFVFCDPTRIGEAVAHRALFPAIAVPVEKKNVFECPQPMVEELGNVLPSVTRIIVIGWRATETHFLDLLKQHLKPGVFLSVVAGDATNAEDVRVRIHRKLINNPPNSVAESTGFTDFLRSGRAVQILTS
jgi:hypothetical protein